MKVYYAGPVNLATGAVINPGNARGSETSNPAALGLCIPNALGTSGRSSSAGPIGSTTSNR